jgi:hypothetical protein
LRNVCTEAGIYLLTWQLCNDIQSVFAFHLDAFS